MRRSTKSRRREAGLLLLGASLLTTCSGEPLPNVLLVTFDTTRYDRLGCTGDARAQTPAVDSLAARGLLFEHAYASVPLTLPSHTTMLTGLEPIAHGVRDNGKYRVVDELRTLPEILGEAGYATAAFVSAFVLDSRYNLNQGFQVYEDRTDSTSLRRGGVPQRPGAEVVDEALAWLETHDPTRPYFLWSHFYDPHLPRRIDPPFDAIRDPYRAEIATADAQLARLLAGVERTAAGRPTLIVFTADHGESLGQHGESTHGIVAYDSTLRVPLILAGPGVPRGERAKAFARHVDLLPTVLALLGLARPEGLPGRNLLAVGPAEGDSEAVGWFESHGARGLGWAPIEGVRTARWKFTASPEPAELFDLSRDPGETENLLEKEPGIRDALAAAFEAQKAAAPEPDAVDSRRKDLDLAELERLAALGYIDAPARFAPGEEPDPRQFVAVHGWVESARAYALEGEYDAAIDLLETLVESPSVRPLVLRSLAPIYEEAGRFEDAIRTYRRYVEVTGSSEARIGLARVRVRAGQPGEALVGLESFPPTERAVVQIRAAAQVRLGRLDEARRTLDAGYAHNDEMRRQERAQLVLSVAPQPDGEPELRGLLAESPADPILRSRLGFYLAVWGRDEQRDEALALLRAAAASSPRNPELLANLGWGAFRRGDAEQAVRSLEAALGLDGGRPTNRYRLAEALARRGESARALGEVRAALAASPGAEWAGDARALAQRLETALAASPRGDAS